MVVNKKEIEKIKDNLEVVSEKKDNARLTEVVTQKSIAIELDDGKIISDIELLVLIYNKLCKIERSLT